MKLVVSFALTLIGLTAQYACTAMGDNTTTMAPELVCQHSNSSCEHCVKESNCYYCYSTGQCLYYPFAHGFPSPQECDMGEVRWAVCWFNFKAVIISLSVMAGILFVCLTLCVYCCCRKKKRINLTKYAQEDAKREREAEERRLKSLARKNERHLRNDEIRRKYGLMKDDKTSYQRFEA